MAATVLASTLAWAALAVWMARLHRQGITDDLTGLLNRRHLFHHLARSLRQARRSGRPLALVVIDVDNFRAFNARAGHVGGDAVLAAVARTIRAAVRHEDAVGRWGGEEFCVVLPGLGAPAARHVAERVRAAVAAMPPVPGLPDAAGRVTVSVGTAVAQGLGLGDGSRELGALVHRADRAMYQAKRHKDAVASDENIPWRSGRGTAPGRA